MRQSLAVSTGKDKSFNFNVDLTIHNDLSRAAESDKLEDTLNYAQICELSAQAIQQAKPELIEHAANLVLQCLFETFPSIEKLP